MTTALQLLPAHHTRAIDQACIALTKTNDPNIIAKLNNVVDRHVKAIHALDREAQSADRKAVRT